MVYFLGIDISTTATKTLLINAAGEVMADALFDYSYDVPQPLWSEQDPGLWWNATVKGVRKVLKTSGIDPIDIQGIGLTGQMHGLVLLGESGEVLRPSILWNDQRTGSQCDEIRSRLGRERLIQITGNDALTGFTAPKILWVQQNESKTWSLVRQVLLPKDYVRYKLTGTFAVDRAGGAGTILFDIRKRTWSPEMLSALEIPAEYLPETYEGTQVTGLISAEAAEVLGLPAGIPVVGGGG
nr:xylulokinase [Gammaproteobacteria bacterium]